MNVVPLHEAAAALGTSVPGLRRLIADGAPVVSRGGRGRGRRGLVDVDAIAAWRAARCAARAPTTPPTNVLIERLTDELATQFERAYVANGRRSPDLARLLSVVYYEAVAQWRVDHGASELRRLPPAILRLVAAGERIN